MSKVNPPPHLRIPDRFFQDKELRPYFEQVEFILFQLWKRTGGSTDAVESASQYSPSMQAFINDINDRLGSGDALTSDETGFTVDSTLLTVDMVEA